MDTLHTSRQVYGSIGHTIGAGVYYTLRRNIVNLILKPGEALNSKAIAETLEVSRTPVRDAFIRLEKEGLVEVVPQVGTRVSRIDLDRVEEEKFIRVSLEEKATELFMAELREAPLLHLETLLRDQRDCVKRADALAFLELDDDFHGTIFQAVGKSMGWDLVQSISGHYRRVRLMSLWDGDILSDVFAQHEAIYKAMSKGEASEVYPLVYDHFSQIISVERKLLEEYSDYFKVSSGADIHGGSNSFRRT